jgi:threonine dehydrogenase-like Zn-dependent dehydrogenase
MRGAVLYGPRDVRFEERDIPKIINPTDAILRISAACVCGSDLWPYRGIQPVTQPTPMGHEYCGVVEEVGSEVKSVKPGQFVSVRFCVRQHLSHLSGWTSRPASFANSLGAQAPLRVPLADGTGLTPDIPSRT